MQAAGHLQPEADIGIHIAGGQRKQMVVITSYSIHYTKLYESLLLSLLSGVAGWFYIRRLSFRPQDDLKMHYANVEKVFV